MPLGDISADENGKEGCVLYSLKKLASLQGLDMEFTPESLRAAAEESYEEHLRTSKGRIQDMQVG